MDAPPISAPPINAPPISAPPINAPLIEAPRVLPMALLLEGRRCLVVGGGDRAARRVAELTAAGAVVHVVAPRLCEATDELVHAASTVTWSARAFEPEDLDGVHLVVAATDDEAVDQRVFDLAEIRGSFVHCPDDPARCSAYAMACVKRGPVTVAVTTSGTSPALAAYLREWLDRRLEPALGDVAALLDELRRELHERGATTEGRPWRDVVDDALVAMVAAGDRDAARTRLRAAVAGPVAAT
jgi:siroheme synthase-like protein